MSTYKTTKCNVIDKVIAAISHTFVHGGIANNDWFSDKLNTKKKLTPESNCVCLCLWIHKIEIINWKKKIYFDPNGQLVRVKIGQMMMMILNHLSYTFIHFLPVFFDYLNNNTWAKQKNNNYNSCRVYVFCFLVFSRLKTWDMRTGDVSRKFFSLKFIFGLKLNLKFKNEK